MTLMARVVWKSIDLAGYAALLLLSLVFVWRSLLPTVLELP